MPLSSPPFFGVSQSIEKFLIYLRKFLYFLCNDPLFCNLSSKLTDLLDPLGSCFQRVIDHIGVHFCNLCGGNTSHFGGVPSNNVVGY